MIPYIYFRAKQGAKWGLKKGQLFFWAAKRMSHLTEEPGVDAAFRKLDSSDSNGRFWQMLTNVKIRKRNVWGLEELKMMFKAVQEKMFNIYKT